MFPFVKIKGGKIVLENDFAIDGNQTDQQQKYKKICGSHYLY